MNSVPRCLAVLLLGFMTAGAATAGPNEGGVLILHAAPYDSRSNTPDLCGLPLPSDCEDARVNIPDAGFWSWSVLAAFPEGSNPRLIGITFGVDYDDTNTYIGFYEPCGVFEIPQPDWPSPGSGTAMTWEVAQTEELTRVYAFIGYTYYEEAAMFCLSPHPTQGGWFGDDSIPSVLDPITDYGCLGFGTNPGYLPCPATGEVGACCLPDGSCQVMTEAACAAEGGNWHGVGSDCDSDPCAVPTLDESWGSVKHQFR